MCIASSDGGGSQERRGVRPAGTGAPPPPRRLATRTLPSARQRAGLQPGPCGAGGHSLEGAKRPKQLFCTHEVPVGTAVTARTWRGRGFVFSAWAGPGGRSPGGCACPPPLLSPLLWPPTLSTLSVPEAKRLHHSGGRGRTKREGVAGAPTGQA